MGSLIGNMKNRISGKNENTLVDEEQAKDLPEPSENDNAFTGGPKKARREVILNDIMSDESEGDLDELFGEKTSRDTKDVLESSEPVESQIIVEEREEDVSSKSETVVKSEEEPVIEPKKTTDTIEKVKSMSVVVDNSPMENIQSAVASSSYAEAIEGFVTVACQTNNVRNVELSTYGLMALNADYQTLEVLKFGEHKFLGVSYTEQEESIILVRIATHVEKTSDKKVVIKAVQKLSNSPVESYTLLITEEMVQKFADTFGYTVKVNLKTTDAKDLCIVVEKE